MEKKHSDIETVLIKNLENKGIEMKLIPRFIKDLSRTLSMNASMSQFEVNNRLHLLGWTDFELDYHTFQLAKAYFEDA